jgi:hypothetical protein
MLPALAGYRALAAARRLRPQCSVWQRHPHKALVEAGIGFYF